MFKGNDDLVDTTYAETEGGQEYLNLLEDAQAKGDCPFCPPNLAEHNEIIYSAGSLAYQWLLIANRWPYKNSACHLLIIPERHIVELDEITPTDWQIIRYLVDAAKERFPVLAIGGALALRFGTNSGVTIRHLHIHLVAPRTNPETGKVFPDQHVNFPIG